MPRFQKFENSEGYNFSAIKISQFCFENQQAVQTFSYLSELDE